MATTDEFYEEVACRAHVCANAGMFGQAYALFLLMLKLKPERKIDLEDDFCEVWDAWSSELVRLHKLDKMVELYYTGCQYFLECAQFHMITGNCFYRENQKMMAHGAYMYALQIDHDNISARESIDNLCRSIIDNWHYDMLNDAGRNRTFHKAINDSISSLSARLSGSVVNIIDIGSGTGLLSMFGCTDGNTSIVACECDPVMARLGRDIIRSNGFEEKITFHNCLSTDLSIGGEKYVIPFKNRANMVISEIIDAGVFGEGIVPAIDHAWRELLVSRDQGGMVIPSKAVLHVTCIESEAIHKQHCGNIQTSSGAILAVSNVGIEMNSEDFDSRWHPMVSTQEPYTCGRVGNLPHKSLTEYEELLEVNFDSPEEMAQLAKAEGIPFCIELTCINAGYLDAVITSFDLSLSSLHPTHVIKTHIGSDGCWEQCIYPIRSVTCHDNSVRFSRISVKRDSVIILNFLQYCDKIVLDNCVISNDSQTKLLPQRNPFKIIPNADEVRIISLPENDILKISDDHFINFFYASISASQLSQQLQPVCIDPGQSPTIVDLYQARPVLSLCIASKFPQIDICRVEDKSQNSMYFQECTHRISMPNLKSAEKASQLKFSAAMVDVVEHSGLLSESIFTSINETRKFLCSDGCVFPWKLKIMAQVVQSEQLLKRCIIPDKSATLGLDIGSFLQPYRPETLSHLTMQNITYKALSQPFLCEEIDIGNCSAKFLSANKSCISTAVRSGKVHGVLIWYILISNKGLTFDTLDPANSWQQCVFMHRGQALELNDQILSLVYWRNSSYISFDFKL